MANPISEREVVPPIQDRLNEVLSLMANVLDSTPLAFLTAGEHGLFAPSKMLRSRLLFRIGPALGTHPKTLLHAAAATEMIHLASLLHDDVIDGGVLRRGAPAFWVKRGVSGAILLGDMLLIKSLDIICQVENSLLAHPFVTFTAEVCEAEAEQELIFRGKQLNWDECVRIARGKTGALFAFPAYAAAAGDPTSQQTLTEAGYRIGTAYQLADDILDAMGNDEDSGKTVGTDSARAKNTVMSYLEQGIEPRAYIESLCQSARELLHELPKVYEAWEEYMSCDLYPELSRHLELIEK